MPLPCAIDEFPTDFGCLPSNPVGFVEKFYGWGLGLLGMVGVLYMIIGAYLVLMSRGNIEQLQKGRTYIVYSIAGILLAIFGFVFIEIIGRDILKIPGIN